MLTYAQGNLLDADVEALVNTVNCVGVMGKGLALQFKQAYPENFKAYAKACRAGEVRIGSIFVFSTGTVENPKYILNFPTKEHWRSRSEIEFVHDGLIALRAVLVERRIRSIAVPPLGCGNGGLSWDVVRPEIEAALGDLDDVDVRVFAPATPGDHLTRRIRTAVPNLTASRALILRAIADYSPDERRCTQLEIQKLAYFLQLAGQPLKLEFTPALYGPYDDKLNKVLEVMEGHFIDGFDGERSPTKSIAVRASAIPMANRVLADHPDALERWSRVQALIDGFQTPYGMELLASVHWIAAHSESKPVTTEFVLDGVRAWNRRKGDLFTVHHVNVALERIRSEAWLGD